MNHEHDDQSRRTLGATAAKCPELVAPDLDRVRCACGQPRPTDAGTDLVREYARLSVVSDAAHFAKEGLGFRCEPTHDATDEAWYAYAKWKREYAALDARYHKAFSDAYNFTKANLAALKAALGVDP